MISPALVHTMFVKSEPLAPEIFSRGKRRLVYTVDGKEHVMRVEYFFGYASMDSLSKHQHIDIRFTCEGLFTLQACFIGPDGRGGAFTRLPVDYSKFQSVCFRYGLNRFFVKNIKEVAEHHLMMFALSLG